MKRKKVARGHHDHPVSWLPVDSRLFGSLFSFGHVRGIARVFLEIEMVLAVLVVIGTLVLLVFSLLK